MDAILAIQGPEHITLQKGKTHEWSESDVRAELENILNSRLFSKSLRLSRFLRVSIEYLLDGRANHFKEYTVGIEVYERQSSYDPAIDSIVRTEARRLRSKLKEYYATSPRTSPVIIEFVAGSYIPKIHVAGSQPAFSHHVVDEIKAPSSNCYALNVAILPLRAPDTDLRLQDLASELTDDLVHQLSQRQELNIFRPTALNYKGISNDEAHQLKSWKQSMVHTIIHGCVRQRSEGIALNLQIATIDGMVRWSGRFQLSSTAEDCDGVSEELSKILMNGVSPGGAPRVPEYTPLMA